MTDDAVAARWGELMTPWDDPHSAADGILDDETYDWLGVFEVMRRSGGAPVVVPESAVLAAHELASSAGFGVSATGSAGLAALLAAGAGAGSSTTTAVLFTGRDQLAPGPDTLPGSVPA
jgi:hypothetical protein